MNPEIVPVSDDSTPGLHVIDRILHRRIHATTEAPVDVRPGDPDVFPAPVTTTAEVTVSELAFENVSGAFLHPPDDDTVVELTPGDADTYDAGRYVLELAGSLVCYLSFDAAATVLVTVDETSLVFGTPTTVTIGARSFHTKPHDAPVVTTSDPRDVMRAVSTFGSVVKTWSPERSFPTLRGHPPKLEHGDALDVPDGVAPPDTGFTITVPETLGDVYTVASLAHYLGATVEPGPRPRLTSANGAVDVPLDAYGGANDLERGVDALLQHLFTLDCVTRTEGLYEVNLAIRNDVEDRLPGVDWQSLYDRDLVSRTAAYLDVPPAELRDLIPTWRSTTFLPDSPDGLRHLPYAVNDLSAIRQPPTREIVSNPPYADDIEDFLRARDATRREATTRSATPSEDPGDATPAEFRAAVRSGSTEDAGGGGDTELESYVGLPSVASQEAAWGGDGRPLGADKLVPEAYENHFSRPAAEDEVTITVVCNDDEMWGEYSDELYGSRDEFSFDLTVRRNLGVDELRGVFEAEHDFVHYIGHIEADDGFVCHDGTLPVTDIRGDGPRAFLLNGCESYEQGIRLVEAGSIAGVVTLSDVGNRGAIEIGQTLARLINQGFSLRSALEVARDHQIIGNQYVVVGEGSVELIQSEGAYPLVIEVFDVIEGDVEPVVKFSISLYPTSNPGLGGFYSPHVIAEERIHMLSTESREFETRLSKFTEFLNLDHRIPVSVETELKWPTASEVDSVPDYLRE